MKKYYSKNCKYIFIVAVIGFLLLLVGTIIAIAAKNSLLEIKLSLLVLGGITATFATMIFFAERSRWIALSQEILVLPRGVKHVDENCKTKICTKRTLLNITEIASFERNLYKGDKIISADTYFYSFKTVDGKIYDIPLYSYTEDTVNQIVQVLSSAGVKVEF